VLPRGRASRCAKKNLQVVNFLTDNEMVATAAQKNSLCLSPGHWPLRPILVERVTITQGMQHLIIKVRRETNKVADKLAKQARQASVTSSCLYSCEAFTHSRPCNVQQALQTLQNFQWGMFRPISVLCL